MIWISDLNFAVSFIYWEKKSSLTLLIKIFNIMFEMHRKHVWFINLNQKFLKNLKTMWSQIIKQRAWFKITSSNIRFFLFLSNIKFFLKLNLKVYFECNEHTVFLFSKLLLWMNLIFRTVKDWSAQFHEHLINTDWVRFCFWNSFLTLLKSIKKKLRNLSSDNIRFWSQLKIIISTVIRQICNLNWNWKN